MAAAKPTTGEKKLIAKNRRARFDYHVLETHEAGLELLGTEVKSLREGKANLSDSYAVPRGRELFLVNANIARYDPAGPTFNHDPLRPRRLLMHRAEIDKLLARVREKGLTLIPLELYFLRGRAKVELGLCKGKVAADRREAIAEREHRREIERATRRGRRTR